MAALSISELLPGDVVRVNRGRRIEDREVVRVIDTTGARGGIVDTREPDGSYSEIAGFVLGDEISFAFRDGDGFYVEAEIS